MIANYNNQLNVSSTLWITEHSNKVWEHFEFYSNGMIKLLL